MKYVFFEYLLWIRDCADTILTCFNMERPIYVLDIIPELKCKEEILFSFHGKKKKGRIWSLFFFNGLEFMNIFQGPLVM